MAWYPSCAWYRRTAPRRARSASNPLVRAEPTTASSSSPSSSSESTASTGLSQRTGAAQTAAGHGRPARARSRDFCALARAGSASRDALQTGPVRSGRSGLLDGVPFLHDLLHRGREAVLQGAVGPEHMRVAADHLGGQPAGDVVEREACRAPRRAGRAAPPGAARRPARPGARRRPRRSRWSRPPRRPPPGGTPPATHG